ncbi:MAG: hypothetical protein HY064_01380 [Bacteroidetes bacterium]|nr:hypothetical protein [Bacteroidota bacterium]
MKKILLTSLFIPAHFFAQVYGTDVRYASDYVKKNNIGEQKTTVLVTYYKKRSQRDSTLLDTAVIQTGKYDKNGNIASADYRSILDKANYHSHSDYFYLNGKLTKSVTKENDVFSDSTLFFNSGNTDYSYRPGYLVIHERYGDTLLVEKRITGNDTVIHRHTEPSEKNKTHWDEEYTGAYSSRIIHSDSLHHCDSCFFYDEKSKLILTIIDYYDKQGRVTCSDYYNRGVKNLLIYSARYNLNYNMATYIGRNKNGERSCRITRSYNEKGQLTEIKHTPSKQSQGITDIRYSYKYY